MIFVTVGTHEQPFDRLIACIDNLKASGAIEEEVIIQTGFSTYEPKHCTWSKLLPYKQMVQNVADARIVITHGGPASFLMPLQIGKVPIVVPRQAAFGEHVNDHQLIFALEVEKRQRNILVVEDIAKLPALLAEYDKQVETMTAGMTSNNEAFMAQFSSVVQELV